MSASLHAPSSNALDRADTTVQNEVREPSCLRQLAARYGSFGGPKER
jgi:hypothetical protein